jgi:arylsulfatase A-like enzyme
MAPSSWTLPSHATMLTGLYPCEERLKVARHLPSGATTLAEMLRAAGYTTGAFAEDGWVSAAHGFARGFGHFVERRRPNLHSDGPPGDVEGTIHDALVWIDRHPDVPWFAFVHTYQVHVPYAPPPGYVDAVTSTSPEGDFPADSTAYDAEIRPP